MKNNLKVVLFFLISALIISIIILAYVPPISKDALTHHLAVPKLFLNNGGLYEIPSITFSYYPMNLDLLYIIPLYMGNDIIPKYIHFGFALLTAWLIFNYLKHRLNLSYALLGVLFFLSIPIIIKLSITVYVDLGLIFFSTASLIYLLKWINHSYKLRFLVISAIWCGLAVGTKYNGLITLFLLTFFIPLIYLRLTPNKCHQAELNKDKSIALSKTQTILKQKKAIGYAGLFLGVALIVFSPWMIRNIMWIKNPVYPLYDNLFKFRTSNFFTPQEKEKNDEIEQTINKSRTPINHFSLRKFAFKESWWQTALIPVRIFFSGKDGTPAYFDGKLNPFLCILPIFAFIGKKKDVRAIRAEKVVFLAFSVLYLSVVFFQIDMRIRWIAPIIPPLVILSIFGLNRILSMATMIISNNGRKFGIVCVLFLISAMLFVNAKYIAEQFNYVDPFSYISGRLGRDEYIKKYRPEYPAIQYANKNLPESAKIYCIFIGMRRYYSDRELIFFSVGNLLKTIKSAGSSESILSEIEKNGATHILVGFDLLDSWSFKNLDIQDREMLKSFFQKHTHLLFSNGKYGLYSVH